MLDSAVSAALRRVAEQPPTAWSGSGWRTHRRVYAATDATGATRVSGRYHRAPDVHPEATTWVALYLALGPETSLGEIVRHVSPALLAKLNDLRLTELRVELGAVLDIRDPEASGLPRDALWHDTDYTIPQRLARVALECGAEGLLVPSATRLGDNLIVVPANLRPLSTLAIVGARDPRLFIPHA